MTQREDKERNKTARECLGKFFYDLAKTCSWSWLQVMPSRYILMAN